MQFCLKSLTNQIWSNKMFISCTNTHYFKIYVSLPLVENILNSQQKISMKAPLHNNHQFTPFKLVRTAFRPDCSRYDSLRMIPVLFLYLRTKVLRTGTVIFHPPNQTDVFSSARLRRVSSGFCHTFSHWLQRQRILYCACILWPKPSSIKYIDTSVSLLFISQA